MSFEFTDLVFSAHQLDLDKADLLLLLRLADRANAEGVAWPGIRSLAKDCHVSVGWVSKSLSKLIGSNLVTVVGKATSRTGRKLQLNEDALREAAGDPPPTRDRQSSSTAAVIVPCVPAADLNSGWSPF